MSPADQVEVLGLCKKVLLATGSWRSGLGSLPRNRPVQGSWRAFFNREAMDSFGREHGEKRRRQEVGFNDRLVCWDSRVDTRALSREADGASLVLQLAWLLRHWSPHRRYPCSRLQPPIPSASLQPCANTQSYELPQPLRT